MDSSIRLFLEESDNIQVYVLDDVMRSMSELLPGYPTHERRIHIRWILRRSSHASGRRIHEDSSAGISDVID
jgi:hypothetical protein